MPVTLDDLRTFAVSRSLFPETTLRRALERFGFVQADPIRAPARAQDLMLRHRVKGYRAGDLERLYPRLGVEEDLFVNYGFVTPAVRALMHPRAGAAWRGQARARVAAILEYIRAQGPVHPRDVHEHFSHGTVTNYWGGSSNATTHLLDLMHYRGLLRVVRRDAGVRVYGARSDVAATVSRAERLQRLDALVDVVVGKYAPLPAASLSNLVARLKYGVPQWQPLLRAAFRRAAERLPHARVDGVEWYWPAGETVGGDPPSGVRLLAPFDPIVWDRRRFEQFWGWPYRFEAYTPIARRTRGYYALPLLWRDRVIGWGNVSAGGGVLQADLGYIDGRPPRERVFARELEAELDRLRDFLNLAPAP